MKKKETKKTETAKVKTKTIEVSMETPVAVIESEAKKALRNIIEQYREKNPVKYELKKEELLRQLNALE